jgi:hypothetical protein
MGTASEAHIVGRPFTSASDRMDVVEFEISSRLTTLPARAHESALPLIPLPDSPTNVRRDMTFPKARAGTSRTGRGSKLLPLELQDESLQRPIEHLGDVPTGNRMAKQSLRVSKLLVGPVVDRHLETVALRSRWQRTDGRGFNSPRGEFIAARGAGRPSDVSRFNSPRGQLGSNIVRDEIAGRSGSDRASQ